MIEFRLVINHEARIIKFSVFCANLIQAATDLHNHLVEVKEIADGSDLMISAQLNIPKVEPMNFAESLHSTYRI